ncbi:type II toxin-antitoxin system Phd/YefM family antitoxin [Lentzea sp. NBC_00516]|jgi:prevent-host-death family protein|uniref:type II toxin-antitoxin system Phd/YefM family antitoxin n=1 Tax=Lentzea sp. NBC_00516 TaxID=2903582 RepID=UPI002E806FDE|nr:type II toxin-antitoxin system prevent-host-death family antitoxin [Lentzea sp. NBC_00516]WUD23503.1 type II toxin-antitoxin system Phd/YefM family antitoxin [Lentzea sp. NBC_00516]
MTAIHEARELTVTEATKRGVAGLVADAEQGGPVVVTRHSRPVAAVVAMSRLAEIDEAAADLRDLALVLARSAVDSGRRTSFDDVLAAFGHTRESLAAVEDDDSLDG